MELVEMQSWFKRLPDEKKAIAIIKVMYEMTIVIRSMSASEGREKLLDAALLSSELNHRISNFAVSKLSGQPNFPDDVVISMIDATLADEQFADYAAHVWEKIVKETNGITV